MNEALDKIIALAKEVGGAAWPLLVKAQVAEAWRDIIGSALWIVFLVALFFALGRVLKKVAERIGMTDYDCKCTAPGVPCATLITVTTVARCALLLGFVLMCVYKISGAIIRLNMPEVYAAQSLLHR